MHDKSSIASSFQFISFKIDDIKFSMNPIIGNLNIESTPKSEKSEFGIAFHELTKFKNNGKTIYISGINSKVVLTNDDQQIASGTFSISGLFRCDGSLSPNDELTLAKLQAPTILFPYLRSCITNTLASAGFGSIILPLINVAAAAKEANIKIVDFDDKQKTKDIKAK
jgi:preprotein translocase subunit SecB